MTNYCSLDHRPWWTAISDFNTLRPRQNGRHFADDIFKCIFLNENVWIKVSLKFVPKGPINNIQALVQIMACRLFGAKPLSEPMVARSATHICVTRSQWVKTFVEEWDDYNSFIQIYRTKNIHLGGDIVDLWQRKAEIEKILILAFPSFSVINILKMA